MDCLKLALLGKFQASFGEKPLPPFRTSKVQALLIYLVVEAIAADAEQNQARTSHRREALMELLWPNLQLRAAQDNLRQTLYQLRKAIPDQQSEDGAAVRFLESSRIAMSINPAYHFTTDAADFTSHMHKGALETAVALYRGDFLADFYLTDSSEFEEWAGVRRSAYRRQALEALDGLAAECLDNGRYDQALDYAQKQINIDDLRERAYRQAMEAQARLGLRDAALAHYDLCREKLEEELGVETSLETETLLAQILHDEVREADREAESVASRISAVPATLPEWEEEEERPLFVGRESELDELAALLSNAMEGRGDIHFITGGAGRGKTALVSEFGREALEADPDLLVLSGQCRGMAGTGEPYLPFRQILDQLTGEVSGSTLIGRDQGRRLWEGMAGSIPALVEQGPDLIDTLLNGAELRRRAATVGSTQAAWFRRLNELLDRPAGQYPQQERLFSQVTAVLQAISRERPLLLIVEDLHWTDAASASMLFHLSFELANSRILLLGTYRPEEVAGADEHPLARIGGELKRRYGDIWLDLSEKDVVEGRAFIDAYLDSEPNELPAAFRRKLFAHTGGHALFTVELLRAMQERGDLCRDDAGLWREGEAVDWEALPARIEGVVEQRFGRLDADLQEALSIAAVEGETFTAGIAAEICSLDERVLVRRLSREIEGQHRLVEAEGLAWQDGRRLARYRFRHQLFQQYLYQELADAERVYLHEAVGLKLEALAEDTRAQAAELAWHFDQAGSYEKALSYLLQAGDAARLLYATEEAVTQYERALAILKEQGDYEEAARVLMKLGLTYTNAFDFEAARHAYDESFALKGRGAAGAGVKLQAPGPQTLRIASLPESESLDPIIAGVDVDGLFPGLVRLSSDLDVIPAAARRWEILNNGRTYLFHLRDDIYWSDGRPVTAGDFVYAWRRVLDPEHGSPYAELLYDIAGAAAYHLGHKVRVDELGFKVLDDCTLKVELVEPVAYFLQVIGAVVARAVPRHVVEVFGDAWTDPENIVSSGPFRLHTRDEAMMIFMRDPGFYDQFEGNVKRVEYHFNENLADCLRQYAADEVDVFNGIMSDALVFQSVMKQYASQIWNQAILMTGYYVFDVSRPPFDDSRVRRAFAMATDRRQLAKALGVEQDPPATGGLVPPGMPGHVPDIALPFDLNKARELLAAAGYPGGKELPVLNAIVMPGDEEDFPEYLFKYWEDELGVKIAWKVVAVTECFDTIQREQPHIFTMNWWADYPDPDSFLRVAVRTGTPWQHETFESLISEARVLGDNDRRLELYRQAEEILVQEAPLVPISYFHYRILVKPWVKKPDTFILPQWHKMTIEPHDDARDREVVRAPALDHPAEGKVLRMALLAGDLGPGLDIVNDWARDFGLFPRLVQMAPDLDIVPDAARFWEVSDDGCTYRFHLRDDVYWSDGQRVTAADFVYAWRRMLDPQHGSSHAIKLFDFGGSDDRDRDQEMDSSRISFKILDDRTLEIYLEQPLAYLLQIAAYKGSTAVPKHVVERFGESWANMGNVVTSGPFQVHSIDKNSLILQRDPAYYGRFTGNVQRVEFRVYPSREQQYTNYSLDELDLIEYTPINAKASVPVSPTRHDTCLSGPLFKVNSVIFNVDQPPFDDPLVRRAFALATDRRRLVAGNDLVHDSPATGGLVPPGMPGHMPGIALPFDPNRARQLLEEIGYPGGNGFPVISVTLPTYNDPLIPEHLLRPWQEILGVRLNWHVVPTDEYFDFVGQNRPHIECLTWRADFPDPDNFLHTAMRMLSSWHHEGYDALIEEASLSLDHEHRLDLFRQAEAILIEETPLIPLLYLNQHVFVKSWIKNYSAEYGTKPQWHKVIIEPH